MCELAVSVDPNDDKIWRSFSTASRSRRDTEKLAARASCARARSRLRTRRAQLEHGATCARARAQLEPHATLAPTCPRGTSRESAKNRVLSETKPRSHATNDR